MKSDLSCPALEYYAYQRTHSRTLQVLWAKSVKRTHVRSFQHSPERSNPVRMRLAFDVLGY